MKIFVHDIPRDMARKMDVKLSNDEILSLFEDLDQYQVKDFGSFDTVVRAQKIGSSVRIFGHVGVIFDFECGRCLESSQIEIYSDLEYLLVNKPTWQDRYDDEDDLDLSEDDLGVHYYEKDEIDILPFLREAILLELPQVARCEPELASQCDSIFEKNVGEKTIKKNEEAGIDLRWAKLLELKNKKKQN